MKVGFIYALTNASMPGIFKIGMSEQHPQIRAEQLSKATGVPTPFRVVYYIDSENARVCEAFLHEQLAGYRLANRREFFSAHPTHLWCVMRGRAAAGFRLHWDAGLVDLSSKTLKYHEPSLQDAQEWMRSGALSPRLRGLIDGHYWAHGLPTLTREMVDA